MAARAENGESNGELAAIAGQISLTNTFDFYL
jgi:hypothetical protein